MNRSRWIYALWIGVTMLLGLSSRRYGAWLPTWVVAYVGDALWALLVFWLLRFGYPNGSARKAAWLALGISFLVECSQLYQPAWLNAVRATTIGALVLGHGFLWSDLVCYSIGIGTGYAIETSSRPLQQQQSAQYLEADTGR